MTRPIFVVDAFAREPFRGNPAGVVLLEPADAPEDALMVRVAAEMKHSETAFVRPRPDGDFDLRWFTPEVEVDLCGHATLASAHVLWETDRLAPRLAVFRHPGRPPPSEPPGRRGDRARLPHRAARTLRSPRRTPPDALWRLGTSRPCARRDSSSCSSFPTPRPSASSSPTSDDARSADVRGVYVTTTPGDDGVHDIVSRCFGPGVGIDEDPVTGSMHCVLSAYWCPRFGNNELRAEQASARGGTVGVKLAGDRTLLLGNAVTVLRGELLT